MAIAIANARRPVVRHKATWSDPWITLERGSYELSPVARGLSSVFGSATITTWRTAAVNREEDAPAEPTIDVDHLVQIGAEDPDLLPENADAIRWLWMGIVQSTAYEHLGTEVTGTEQSLIVKRTFSMEGLASLFQRVIIGRSLVRAHTGAAVVLERALVFNADGLPDRSITAAGSIYPFRLDLVNVARWTARQAIEHLLHVHMALLFPNWPTFTLTGQTALLDYIDTFDLAGKTLAEALTLLCGGPRGGSWSIEPADAGTGTVAIRITSSLLAPITIAGFGDVPTATLPASDRIVAQLDTGDSHYNVASSIMERPRAWTLVGTARTTLTVTWRPGAPTSYDGLTRGWNAADDSQAGSSDDRYAGVFIRFVIDQAWSGLVSASAGIGATGGRSGSDYDGSLIAGGDAPIGAVRLSPDLVIAERASNAAGTAIVGITTWATDSSATIPKDLPRDKVRIYYTADGSAWYDITDDFQVTVTNDPVPSVLIGRNTEDAAKLNALLGTGSGRALAVTLTAIDPAPILISREPAARTADQRIRTDHEVHQVLPGTIVGVTGTTAVRTTSTRTIRDDRPAMRALRAQLGPYLDRAGSATITDRLHLLPLADCRPGTLVRAYDDGRRDPIDLRAVITQVTWNFDQGAYGTTISLEPITLDPRAYL